MMWRILRCTLLLAFLIASCSNAPPQTTAPSATDTTVPAAGLGPGPSNLDLDDPSLYSEPQGFDFTSTLEFSLVGSAADGSEVRGAFRAEGSRSLGPPLATQVTFNAEGNADMGVQNPFIFTQIGEQDYIYAPVTGCIALNTGEAENPFSMLLDAGGLLGGEADLIESGLEVNGVLVDRYSIEALNIDPTDPSAPEVVEITNGYIDVAREGRFIVRVVLIGTGRSELLTGDPTIEGDISYELNYLPSNQPINIHPPPECDSTGFPDVDYPTMDDANVLTSLPGATIYLTQYSFQEVVDFYQAELPEMGWSLVLAEVNEPTAILTFSNLDSNVQVSVFPDPGGDISVSIVTLP